MVAQFESTHEAVGAYETDGYGNPETMFEWETDETSHAGSPYAAHEHEQVFEDEVWGGQEMQGFSSPYAAQESIYESGAFEGGVFEGGSYEHEYSGISPEFATAYNQESSFEQSQYGAFEDESIYEDESGYQFEDESIYEDEWAAEGDPFISSRSLKRLGRGIRKVGRAAFKRLGKIAKGLAPIAAGALGGMIPGLGAVTGPLAAKLAASVVREGEMEAAQVEAQLFGTAEGLPELANTEIAHEAALTEFLAYEAGLAESEDEATAMVSSTLPITVAVMGAVRVVRPVMPALTQANARVARVLISQGGPDGRRLLSLMPPIQRRAVGMMKAAARRGQPVTSPLAIRAMQAATTRVLNDPRQVAGGVARSAALRQRTMRRPRRAQGHQTGRRTPYNPRRAAVAGGMGFGGY